MYIPVWPYILTFFVLSFYSFLNISSCYSLLILLFISLLILLFLYLNCLLYYRHANWTTLNKGTLINGKSNEKTPRKFQFGKKSAKIYHCLYSSKEQLQVALWTYMFLMFGFNTEKSLHTLPLRSVSFLSLPLYPSLFNPSPSYPWSVWLPKLKE